MLLKNSSIYIVAKIIPGLMAFTALSVYTHLLTPAEYGVYTLILTAAMFLNTTFFNWLPVGMIRFWPGGQYSETTFISTLGRLYFLIIAPFTILLLILLLLLPPDQALTLLVGFVLLLGFMTHRFGMMLKTSQILPTQHAIIVISYAVLALALGSLFAWLGFGPLGVLVGVAIGMIVPSSLMTYRQWLLFSRSGYSPDLSRKLMVYGMPLAASFLVSEVTNVSDRYMLAWMVDKAEAGQYAVGYDLAGNSILMIMNAINLAAYPMIVKLLDTEGKEAALKYFNTYATLLLGVSIPAVVGLSLVGPNLVNLVIGEDYRESVLLLLPIITTAIFFMGAGTFYMHLPFQLGNNNMGIFKIAAFIAVLNLLLNLWLIPTMGMMGAAIATLASFVISAALGYFYGKRVFAIPIPGRDILKILLATLIMGLCLYYLKDLRGWGSLLLQIISGGVVFGVITLLLNTGGVRQFIK